MTPPDLGTLVAQLADADRDLRLAAARALAQAQDAHAVEPLCAVLADWEPGVRAAAVDALVAIGEPALGGLLWALEDWRLDVSVAGAEGLARLGGPAVAPLCARLVRPEAFVRGRAAWTLGRIGDARAVEPLCLLLSDPLPGVACAAAKALGGIADPRAAVPLCDVLGRWEIGAEDVVLDSLVRIGAASVVPVCQLLRDARLDRIWAARRFLGRWTQSAAWAPARAPLPMRILADERMPPAERVTVLRALCRTLEPDLHLRARSVGTYCRSLVEHPEPAVRQGAAKVLRHLESKRLLRPAPAPSDRLVRPASGPPVAPPESLPRPADGPRER